LASQEGISSTELHIYRRFIFCTIQQILLRRPIILDENFRPFANLHTEEIRNAYKYIFLEIFKGRLDTDVERGY
jgi:hypothetical protein